MALSTCWKCSRSWFWIFPLPSTNFGIFPWSNTSLVQDVDINVFYKPLLISLDNIIPTSPGYCKIIMKESTCDTFLQDCIVKSGSQALLSGRLIIFRKDRKRIRRKGHRVQLPCHNIQINVGWPSRQVQI